MTSATTFEVVRELTQKEVSSLIKERYAGLVAMTARYLPEIRLNGSFPCKPEYLDALRTSWLLDPRLDKPPHVTIVRALGAALGAILQASFGMKWCVIKDTLGESLSLIAVDRGGDTVSVPPFSYVEKREHVKNAEVFTDLFALLSSKLAQSA